MTHRVSSSRLGVMRIFAAGDVRSKYLRQVITAAADGSVAAMAASAYINEQVHLRSTLLEPEHIKAFFWFHGNDVIQPSFLKVRIQLPMVVVV